MRTGIAFSKTQFCYDTTKYAPLFKIARYNGRDFWEVARFVIRIMEMGDASYKQDEIYIASALVKGKAHIYAKNIKGTNVLDYFITENGNYYTFYVKATTRNSQVVAHIEYSNNIGFLQATPYEYFDQSRPESYIAVDGQSHSGGSGGTTPSPDIPDDPTLVHPEITLVQSDAWLDGDGSVNNDNGKNEYDVIKFKAVENMTYSYNYGCINPAGSVIVFKLSYGNTESIKKANIPTNGQFTTPADCVEVMMSIRYGTKERLQMHIGTDVVTPDPQPDQPQPPVNPDPDPSPDTPTYPAITLVQSDAWIDGTGKITSDGGKNQYDVIKFAATANTAYSYNYAGCINRKGSVIVFKLSYGNTESLQNSAIPNNGVFTTPADCVEVMMSIKYGTKDDLNMRTGSYPSAPPTEPDPEPEQPPVTPTPVHPEITLVQADAWLNGAGEVFGDNGKNEYDVIKFTATQNTTYSYNYADCINPAGSIIVFKFSYGNTDSIQKANIPSNGQFTTPAACVEVMMSIKHGSKDSLNVHTVV